MFPIERIGSTKNAFTGYVDDVRLGTNADFASTMPLDYAVLTANQVIGKNGKCTTCPACKRGRGDICSL